MIDSPITIPFDRGDTVAGNKMDERTAQSLANCIRALSIDAVEAVQSGHPGAPMGMADAATVLFRKHLKFDASAPDWPDRDRFILSNGHASMLLYSVLHLTGYADMTIEQIRNFRQLGSITAGHPEFGHAKGVEVTTGPLGQGLGMAVGMAMAERRLAQEFGPDLVDHRTYVFLGDGCLQEGIGQEAISLAGHYGLGKLIVLYDDNEITIDGPTSVSFSEDVPARFRACGWQVESCDGHDHQEIDAALIKAKNETDRPSMIALKTTIGYGAPTKAGTSASHGAPLGQEEAAKAKENLGWTLSPFEIPSDLRNRWRAIGSRGEIERGAWEGRLAAAPEDIRNEFERRLKGEPSTIYPAAVAAARDGLFTNPKRVATRRASQLAIEALAPATPELIGGSADLTGSNLTRVAPVDQRYTRKSAGNYIGYGVREFGMAAAMNGMSAHGGVVPYGGTFLAFSDYARNAIRLSALMRVGTIYVMTHDSIGLGEDGPTHQPIEHLASLRAIPHLNVFRPADTVETLECWDLALLSRTVPSLLSLSRQDVPQVRLAKGSENLSARGAYVLHETEQDRDVTLLATGTEVSLAIEAREALSAQGVSAAVVSMPCWRLFDLQAEEYRMSVLGTAPRIAVEAASVFGWSRYTGTEVNVIGLTEFGASAPADELYRHFGLNSEAIVDLALERHTKAKAKETAA